MVQHHWRIVSEREDEKLRDYMNQRKMVSPIRKRSGLLQRQQQLLQLQQ